MIIDRHLILASSFSGSEAIGLTLPTGIPPVDLRGLMFDIDTPQDVAELVLSVSGIDDLGKKHGRRRCFCRQAGFREEGRACSG